MFENILKFFRKIGKSENKETNGSKNKAKERLHLVLMQDRANVSADFLELMKQEIIDVIKKYIEVDESAIDVRLTNKENEDGTNGAPALYANIPILNIKEEARKNEKIENKEKSEEKVDKKESLESEKEKTEKEKMEKQKTEKQKAEKQEIKKDKIVEKEQS